MKLAASFEWPRANQRDSATIATRRSKLEETTTLSCYRISESNEVRSSIVVKGINIKQQQHESQANNNKIMPTTRSLKYTQDRKTAANRESPISDYDRIASRKGLTETRRNRKCQCKMPAATATILLATTTLLATVCLLSLAANPHQALASSNSSNVAQQMVELARAEQKDFRRHTKRSEQSETLDDSGHPHYEPLTLGDSSDGSQHSSDLQSAGSQPEPEGGNALAGGAGNRQQARGKKTLYACEEKQLQIECQQGESIHLIRANYGRFSIQICNEHGQLDWKVNCMSPASFQIISNSCQAKQSCQLLASNSIFGDACPGTQKYLEVHYQCVSGGAINNRTATLGNGGELLPANQQNRHSSAGSTANQVGQQSRQQQQQQLPSNKQSVIQQPQQPQQDTSTITSEIASRPSYAPTMQTMFGWPVASQPPPTTTLLLGRQQQTATSQLALPPWIREVPLATGGPAAFTESSSFGSRDSNSNSNFNSNSQATPQSTTPTSASIATNNAAGTSTRAHCPETVWRQIRWPATEAGQLVQMPCPAHAHSGNPADAYPASFTCLPNANWAPRVQAARCQSIWLRNLTQRLEAGDSPLSIVNELALRTKPATSTPLMAMVAAASGAIQQQQQNSWSGAAQNYASLLTGQQPGLFGDDIVQIGRIVRRLVVELDELLNRIADDKQRLAFAREMVQSLAELVNNLAHEQQLDAWLDLAPNLGERQRIAGQLVQSLERATVLLASSAQGGHSTAANSQQRHEDGQESSSSSGGLQHSSAGSFVKVTENAYVAIKTLPLPSAGGNRLAAAAAASQQQQPALLEVSFPSETSTLGTKWQGAEQRFTLHLQTSSSSNADQESLKYQSGDSDEQQQPQVNSATAAGAGQTLKIVFVMIRGLGAQMEPKTLNSMPSNSNDQEQQQQRLVVNSDLVSLSIVADPRHKYAPVKVDFSAPIELVFRHLDSSTYSARQSSAADWLQQQAGKQRGSQPVCVHWDSNISDWLSKGCKLIGTNRTHSTCACKDLAPFALLSEWDEQQFGGQSTQAAAFDGAGQSQLHRQQEQQQHKVQLDSVENELILPTKMLHLAKMLDGRLFDADQQEPPAMTANPTSNSAGASASLRLLIYVSCLVSAALLALHLAAAAYNQAHARRLLGAIPTQPPPPLLVSNSLMSASMRNNSSMPSGLHHLQQQQQQQPHHLVNSNSADLASYGSDYSAALNANKIKLQTEAAASGVGFDSPTMQAVFSASASSSSTSSSGGKAAPSIGASSSILRQLNVPIHLLVQLLALELLIVLLVESQNHLQRASAARHAPLVSYYSNAYYSQQASTNLFGSSGIPMLDPIGTITWVLVLSLYYLIASITCWLLGQLIKLNHCLWISYCCARSRANSGSVKQLIAGVGQLVVSSSSGSTSSSSGSDKSVQYGMATNSTAMSSAVNPANSAGSIYGRQLVVGAQAASNNLYNAPGNNSNGTTSCYGQQQQSGGLIHSSTSPTSSFSSTGGQSSTIMAPTSHHLQHQSATLGKARAPLSSRSAPIASSYTWLAQVLDPSSGKPLNLLAVHTLPVLWVALIAWLSASQSQTVNSFAFTTSFSSQLASWPLLVDASSSSLATLLYYGPTVCLILLGLAVFALRRGQRLNSSSKGTANDMQATRTSQPPPSAASVVNPYGSSSFVGNSLGLGSQHHLVANNFLVSSSSGPAGAGNANGEQRGRELAKQQQQMALNKQSMSQEDERPSAPTAAYYWQTADSKKAKFVCTMLLALLALHSICWISFFAYLYRALNWPSHSTSSGHCCYLIYLFSLTNLLLVLLIIWSQRRALRRAAQLAGLTRLLGCLCACFTSHASAASRQRARFYRAHQQQGTQTAIGKSASGGIKVSPSSQSLFLVSQAAQQQQQQQQQYQLSGQPNYHYGPSYHSASSSQALQAQQHLYQSLANQQHIYDSTTAINEQQQQQLNVMQLMQQQQQQHHLHQQMQQQHNSFTLNRPMQLPSMQQRQPMTLKPMVGGGMMPFGGHSALDSNGQLLVLDANGGLKQQQSFLCHNNIEQARARQQQQSGEADGPLVAFSSSLSPATFGPNISAHHASAATNHNQLQASRQQQQQQQMFSQQQQDQQSSQSSSPVNCNSAATTSSYSGASGAADANQHQYCSITTNNNASGDGSAANRQAPANYTDALKAMMQQQQQNESSAVSQHFRRKNSKLEHQQRHQPAMIDRQAADCASNGNIYDVANYALGQ